MTTLTQQLARLNALNEKRTRGEIDPEWYVVNDPEDEGHQVLAVGADVSYWIADCPSLEDADFIAAAPEAVALANKLHELLIEAEGALAKVLKCREVLPDGRVSYLTAVSPFMGGGLENAMRDIAELLKQLHAAGINQGEAK